MADDYRSRRTSDMQRESGSFWLRYFQDADKMRAMYASLMARDEDWNNTAIAIAQAASLRDAEPYRELSWAPVVFNVSDAEKIPVTYGEGRIYGDGVVYGETGSQWRVSTPYKSIELLVDTPGSTELVLYRDIDFISEDGYLVFDYDPALLPTYVDETGAPFVSVWACGFELDADDLYRRWGATFDFHAESSRSYQQALYALLQGRVLGPTVESLETFVSAAYLAPAATRSSIISVIDSDWLATEHEVITRISGDTPNVEVGDTALPGRCLTDSVRIGTLAQLDLDEIQLGAEFFVGIDEAVTFENTDKAVTVIGSDDDNTYIAFDLGGATEDVAAILAALNTSAPNIASYLDRRRSIAGPPTAADLPTTVNPYELLAQYVGDRLLIIYVNQDLVGREAPAGFLRHLRELLPPVAAAVLVVESQGVITYTPVSSLV